MEDKADTQAAREYHEVTKHSPANIRSALRRLDWANKPNPFKVYEERPRTALPTDFSSPAMATLEAISSTAEDGELDLRTLAALLYFAAGITKEARTPDGSTIHFRAAACAGALYPIELYVVCEALDDLPSGVYHFAPRDFALTTLRAGDFRSNLAEGAGEREIGPSATVALTATFWRSAWKYQARAYRYCFWDSGTILANLLATARSAGLGARIVAGFDDPRVNHLLGVDGIHEASLCLVSLGPSRELPSLRPEVPSLDLKTVPLSREEVEYPPIQALHQASNLADTRAIQEWKGSVPQAPEARGGPAIAVDPSERPGGPLGETILRRGSTRRFRRTPIASHQLGSILHHATRGFEADFLDGPDTRLVDLYLILNEVAGLSPGTYYYAGDAPELELLKEGEFRQWAGFLGLEQALPADASAVVFFLADLNRVLRRFGDRGYRIAQLEAGILGGRMYLAAYSLGLGATGLTFYDDEIIDFFSPHAEGKDAIFMVALGKAIRAPSNVKRVAPPFAEDP